MNHLITLVKEDFDHRQFEDNPIDFLEWEEGEQDRLMALYFTKFTENDWLNLFADNEEAVNLLFDISEDDLREVSTDKLGDQEAA